MHQLSKILPSHKAKGEKHFGTWGDQSLLPPGMQQGWWGAQRCVTLQQGHIPGDQAVWEPCQQHWAFLLSMKSSSPVGGRAKPELINSFSSAKPGVVMGYNRGSRAAAYSHEVLHPCPWGGSWVWKSTCRAFVLPSLTLCGVRWVGFGWPWTESPTLLCAVLIPAPLRSKLLWDHLKKA